MHTPNRKTHIPKYFFKNRVLIHILPMLVFFAVGAGLAMYAGQDANWDLANYHYYNGYSLVHHRENVDFAAAGLQTYLNPLADSVTYVLISRYKPLVASAILGATQSINIWFVYELSLIVMAAFLKNKKLILMSVVIAMTSFFGATSLGEIGTTLSDNLVSIPVLASILLMLISFRKKDLSAKHALLAKYSSYILMGIAAGIKLTNAPFAIGLVSVEILNHNSIKLFIRNCAMNMVFLVSGFMLSTGFWSLYLWRTYKNPFFPFYNGIFHSPYYPGLNFVDTRFFQHSFIQTVFFPFYFLFRSDLTSAVHFTDLRIPLLYLSLLGLLIWLFVGRLSKKVPKLRYSRETKFLVLFIGVGYLFWLFQFAYYRYIVVLEYLSLLTIIALIWSAVRKPQLAFVVTILIVIPILALTKPMNFGRLSWQPTFFGVQLPAGFIDNNATVLMLGQPISYLVPSFPQNASFIGIENNLASPLGSNIPARDLIKSKIALKTKESSQFYAIEVGDSEDSLHRIKEYGFRNVECRPISSNLSKYFKYYNLCKLENLTV